MNSSLEYVKAKENYFANLGAAFFPKLKAEEAATLSLSGEQTLFARFNHAKVRQVTEIEQGELVINLILNKREIKKSLSLTWKLEQDLADCFAALNEARVEQAIIPESPYLIYPENKGNSSHNHVGTPLDKEEILDRVLLPVKSYDFAGLLASGIVIRANMNSAGQSHWFSTESFFVDYSLYSEKQKAVKSCYSNKKWDQSQWEENVKSTIGQLQLMELPVQNVSPGRYRTYFSPAATAEILERMKSGSFGAGPYKQGFCALKDLYDKKRSLSSKVTLVEDFSLGLVPRFNDRGEVAPEKINLVEKGEAKNLLVSSQSALEYGLESNAALDWEYPQALHLHPGQLKKEDILKSLGTGLYVSNLHYLNWSDQPNARMTGMTRFACFWVEEGQIKGPIKDLRFDETVYNAFGSNLIDLTNFTEIVPSVVTYSARSLGGDAVPGILVDQFSYTL